MAKRKEPRRPFTPPVTPAEGKMVIAVQEKLARIRQMLAREAVRKRQERRSNPSSLTTATLDATFALSSRPRSGLRGSVGGKGAIIAEAYDTDPHVRDRRREQCHYA
jgi:hypothetical protein